MSWHISAGGIADHCVYTGSTDSPVVFSIELVSDLRRFVQFPICCVKCATSGGTNNHTTGVGYGMRVRHPFHIERANIKSIAWGYNANRYFIDQIVLDQFPA